MKQASNFSLAPLTTFQVPARAGRYVRFDAPHEIAPFLKTTALRKGPHLILGGGSNLLFVDDFNGLILHPFLKGTQVLRETRDQVWVHANAGENWDDLVALAVDRGWGGIENLSWIPGSVGASVVQNIGAYGVEVCQVVDRIEAISLIDGQPVTIAPQACGFGYRMSHFKTRWKNRYIITAVTFKLHRKPRLMMDYAGVQTAVAQLGAATLTNLRAAIIALRQQKLPDPKRQGNGGSFFKNPIVSKPVLNDLLQHHPDLPHYPQSNGNYKLAAGWLIETCGWKGKAVGRAAVHDKQALVLINLGQATGREIFELAEQVHASVMETFGIGLQREVIVVGNQSK